MKNPKIRMSLEDLKNMVSQMENYIKYGSMTETVLVTMESHPNGRKYIQFEQPCGYRECVSAYYRYNEKAQDYERRIAE